ncbi:hypothetical protein [Vitiosangium sp. GDMCC 1.1324]|uniref:hypothetical protein n=1 Tax=Vitiosangium sp. (strain GDMCC 1.1324) TaxID=2138576 RepID=UPI000D34DBE3|nr:hypothetical protein [Vitiosangium sp. GDMCC 1.1324]PTL79049.1 hypothetical protein DAT35_36145 [Vitiosangium sp. GDMCC 1.1324]
MLSCLLVLELLMAAPPAEAAPDPFHWKVLGLVSSVDVSDRMNVGGIPIRFQVYTSREKVERLIQYFATAFDEAGFYIQRQQPRLSAEPQLTALDTRTFTSYTVILRPQPGRLTEVVLGEAKLGELQPVGSSSLLPVFPGAANALQGNFEGAQTLTYQVAAKELQVRAWYREQLTHAGYKEESPGLFRRGEQELQLSLSSGKGGLQVVLFLKTAGEPPPLAPSP